MTVREALSQWNTPPRAHGDFVDDRTVSFLELFYDLIFVILVAQIAHTLAGDVTWAGLGRFVVLFMLVWPAWVSGSVYHDLHGGENGRSRGYIFCQMGLLAVLASFASHAADDTADGQAFAITYALLLTLLAWQWWQVRKQDSDEVAADAGQLIAPILVFAAVVAGSAAVSDSSARLWIWAAGVVVTGIINSVLTTRSTALAGSIVVSESLAERFGLFAIIVLGEPLVGVVDGIADSDHSGIAIVTGVLTLPIAFGVWWCYFDFVGLQVPRPGASIREAWVFLHLPLACGIAAFGAACVSFIEHAGDGRTPAETAWLLSGSLSVILLSIAGLSRTLDAHPGRRLVPISMAMATVVMAVLAVSRPTPWLFATVTVVTLNVVWWEAFVRHARSGYLITSSD